jgi:pimeloyl-ACP methyl ester carboxylesterase
VAGAAGAAVTGVAVGVAARKHSRVASERRRLATQLSEKPPQLAGVPESEPSSVTADDGVRISAEEIEARDGNPALTVVLVHGFALDRRTWHFQRQSLPALSDPSIRVVLYDQRSHGRSERAPQESCTIEQLGHDLDAVIRALAPEGPLVLVGHSMGGMTIMALATSPAAVGLLARLQPTLVETARRALGDVIWSLTRRFAYGDRNIAPWLVDLVDTMISTNAVDALIDFADTVNSHNRVAALPALARCEVLVASGTADHVIPVTHSDVIAAELPDARLVHFEGAGHLPMLEQPAAMDEVLIDLIRRSADRVRPRRFRWRA